jgi:hypothetical protein
MKTSHPHEHSPAKPKKPGPLYPKTPAEWLKTEVEDSIMALITGAMPSRQYTADMVRSSSRDEFDKTVRRLRELRCREDVLFYCLSRLKFPPELKIPTAASITSLAKRMERVAHEIKTLEGAGFLQPFDERELSGDLKKIILGRHVEWIHVLPQSLERRAGMYRKFSNMFASQKQKLRRDLLSRVNRLCLIVYVKLATNPPDANNPMARHDLAVTLMRCVGASADRSQIKRELEHFENIHFQAHTALQDRLRRMHDLGVPKSVGRHQ